MATNAERSALIVPPMTAEEEDAMYRSRITNDEKGLRRVIRKFHAFATTVNGAPTTKDDPSTAMNDAREAFLLELASFELSWRKSIMICEAESRQVEEYESERRRIANEHENLRGQIEQLKTSLEHAQILRKRKIEYDAIAEKINALPSRDELNLSIQALESDMAAIRLEQETKDRMVQAQRTALHEIVFKINDLRLIGKDVDTAEVEEDAGNDGLEAGEEREDLADNAGARASPVLNPTAKVFVPSTSGSNLSATQVRVQQRLGVEGSLGRPSSAASGVPSRTATPLPAPRTPAPAEQDDVEMGEVSEVKARRKKPRDEELEEGEATDGSSELSDPPDDD